MLASIASFERNAHHSPTTSCVGQNGATPTDATISRLATNKLFLAPFLTTMSWPLTQAGCAGFPVLLYQSQGPYLQTGVIRSTDHNLPITGLTWAGRQAPPQIPETREREREGRKEGGENKLYRFLFNFSRAASWAETSGGFWSTKRLRVKALARGWLPVCRRCTGPG